MFVFKLQPVLDYRKNIEERILDEFSKIRRELEAEEQKLLDWISQRKDLTDALKKMNNKPVSVDEIAYPLSYIEQIRCHEDKQEKIIAEIKNKLELKRLDLLEAVKKRKAMEKLKERHQEEYEKASRDFEQKNSDEMAVLRFDRRER